MKACISNRCCSCDTLAIMYGLSSDELGILKPLKTPEHIQDFLDTIPTNFEENGDTCMSPRRVLQEKVAHCMEGAMLAALALRLIGQKPLVMDLKVEGEDDDHIVTLFRHGKHWGAISKTNHGTVRYRDPIYRTLRELALSYFHEYTNEKGHKVLRLYSKPIDLSQFDTLGWMTDEQNVFYIPAAIDDAHHYDLITASQTKVLRPADAMERKLGEMLEWKRVRGKTRKA